MARSPVITCRFTGKELLELTGLITLNWAQGQSRTPRECTSNCMMMYTGYGQTHYRLDKSYAVTCDWYGGLHTAMTDVPKGHMGSLAASVCENMARVIEATTRNKKINSGNYPLPEWFILRVLEGVNNAEVGA